VSTATHRPARLCHRASANSTWICVRLHRADRRDRRRQVHPDRCAATGHRRTGRRGVVREGAGRTEVTAEFDTPPTWTQWLEEAGFDRSDTCCCAAPWTSRAKAAAGSTAARPPPQMREHWRAADRHPRPARLAKPDPARCRARVAGRLCQGPPRYWAVAGRTWRTGREGRSWMPARTGHAAARARTAGSGRSASWTNSPRSLTNGRCCKVPPQPTVQRAGPARRGQRRGRSTAGRRRQCGLVIEPVHCTCCGSKSTWSPNSSHWPRCWHPAWPRSRTRRMACAPTCARPSWTRSAWLSWTNACRCGLRWRAATSATRKNCRSLLASWKRAAQARRRLGSGGSASRRTASAQAAYLQEARACASAPRPHPLLAIPSPPAMQGLGMQGGRFRSVADRQPTRCRTAWKTSSFLVAGHPGSTPRPVGKVASGWRTVAHCAGHCRHHQPAGHRADADL
jgi:DNA repair protein RecN (Recombination protein N)